MSFGPPTGEQKLDTADSFANVPNASCADASLDVKASAKVALASVPSTLLSLRKKVKPTQLADVRARAKEKARKAQMVLSLTLRDEMVKSWNVMSVALPNMWLQTVLVARARVAKEAREVFTFRLALTP